MAAKILAFAGSTREGSFNKRLLSIVIDGAREAGAEITRIDLRDYPMPLFDADFEAREGIPEHAQRFRAELKAHQGLIIAAPEYNGSITGVLKNAIDWASRKTAEEEELACFKNKIASVVSASPGPFGGARGLIILRTLLLHLQVMIVPTTMSLPSAAAAFAADGRLADERRHAQAQNVGRTLVATLDKHLA